MSSQWNDDKIAWEDDSVLSWHCRHPVVSILVIVTLTAGVCWQLLLRCCCVVVGCMPVEWWCLLGRMILCCISTSCHPMISHFSHSYTDCWIQTQYLCPCFMCISLSIVPVMFQLALPQDQASAAVPTAISWRERNWNSTWGKSRPGKESRRTEDHLSCNIWEIVFTFHYVQIKLYVRQLVLGLLLRLCDDRLRVRQPPSSVAECKVKCGFRLRAPFVHMRTSF